MNTKPTTTEEYISSYPEDVQKVLEQIRSTIRKVLPKAVEEISYGIPCFKLNGSPVIYFAGYAKHVSVYPAPRGNDEFKDLLVGYKGGKGTVQFPLDKKIPLSLITKIAKFRLQDNEAKAAAKKKK